MEAMYGIDEVKINDSHFQFDFFSKTKYFLNLKRAQVNKIKRKLLVDPKVKNDPIFTIMFGISHESKMYERKVKGFADILSRVGGIGQAFKIIGMVVAMFMNKPWIDTKYISIYERNLLTQDCNNILNKNIEINKIKQP